MSQYLSGNFFTAAEEKLNTSKKPRRAGAF
jgi:hypothetical protein